MTDRIPFDEGVRLFEFAPLEELQKRAVNARFAKHPKNIVSFILDSNPNYTNICDADCSFCAFYRKPGATDAYNKTPEEVMAHLEFAKKAGLQTVLLQGGVHEGITVDYLVSLVKLAIERYPDIHPHFFSAVEIWNAANVSHMSVKEALQALFDAGQRTIPGGGAEILSERVRKRISPKKMAPGKWIELHKTAHEIGFKTTATMMYGHIETPFDIVTHLETLRATQDITGGFSSFIPWSYKQTNTALRRIAKKWAGKEAYFRILAFSRIYLDNFSHIAASFFGEGKEAGMEALNYGADDFGGTIHEENVHRATDFVNKADHNDMIRMIRQAGFEPVLRNSFYEIVREYNGVNLVEVPVDGLILELDRTEIIQ